MISEKKTKSRIVSLVLLIICLSLAGLTFFLFGSKRQNNDTGQYVIAIAAIISPFVSLYAAIMFFRAIDAQLDANEAQLDTNNIQQSSLDFSTILKLYEYDQNEIADFLNSRDYEHIQIFVDNLPLPEGVDKDVADFTFKFKTVLNSLAFTVEKIRRSTLNIEDENGILMKVYSLYSNKIRPLAEPIIEKYKTSIPNNQVFIDSVEEVHNIVVKVFEDIVIASKTKP